MDFTMTGHPKLDMALNVLGVIYVVATLVGNLFPNGNKVGALLRRLSVDLRQLRSEANHAINDCPKCAEREAEKETKQ